MESELRLNQTLSTSFNSLLEEARVLKQAIEKARKNPEALEKLEGMTIPPEAMIQQMERALELTSARITGLGLAALLATDEDPGDVWHEQ